jgi:hypothetical protein
MDDLNCCCEFVARIRADERAKFKPYVISGAVQRVEALNWDINTGMDFGLSDVIDAIKGDHA